jgi:phosphonate transport system substrate-binding protein
MNRQLFHRLTFLLAVALGVTACQKQTSSGSSSSSSTQPKTEKKVLRFSAIPNQNSTELKAKFDPIASYLSKELGIAAEFVPAADYKASVEMFKNGQIQLAWFGGVTGVQARHAVAGSRAIVQGREDVAFHSFFIAHKDAGLQKSNDFPLGIADLKFTFGAESSTSGRVMPEYFIRKYTGKGPDEFFKEKPAFSGSHDITCELVESGQFQAGVVDFAVYNKRVTAGTTKPEVCQIIWETPTYPDYNFTAHPSLETDFGAGFTGKLQKVLIEMTTNAPELLKAFPRQALIEATNEQDASLEEICKQLGFVR